MPDFFDRLIDEITCSDPALSGNQLASRNAGRRLRRAGVAWRSALSRTPQRRLLVGVALLCVPGTLSGLALAGTFSGQRISPQQWVDGERVEPAINVSADQAQLGILRRPRVASDVLLPFDALTAAQTPMAATGVNPALSRRAQGFASGAAWVLPGNGTICLIYDNAQGVRMAAETMPPGSFKPQDVARVPGAAGGAACTTDESASKGWSAGTAFTSESPGVTLTAGIVPDGVSSVTVKLADGGTLALPVHENVYVGEIRGWPSSVSFTGAAGAVTIGNGPSTLANSARSARRSSGRRQSFTTAPDGLVTIGHQRGLSAGLARSRGRAEENP